MGKQKIGFIDTDSVGEEHDPHMGYAETYEEDDNNGFWNSVFMYFLIGFGVLSLLKEVTLFLTGLFKRD